eukprot:COSAG02_NODE_1725_length_11184_cov_171.211728_2_plen_112_part_00
MRTERRLECGNYKQVKRTIRGPPGSQLQSLIRRFSEWRLADRVDSNLTYFIRNPTRNSSYSSGYPIFIAVRLDTESMNRVSYRSVSHYEVLPCRIFLHMRNCTYLRVCSTL